MRAKPWILRRCRRCAFESDLLFTNHHGNARMPSTTFTVRHGLGHSVDAIVFDGTGTVTATPAPILVDTKKGKTAKVTVQADGTLTSP